MNSALFENGKFINLTDARLEAILPNLTWQELEDLRALFDQADRSIFRSKQECPSENRALCDGWLKDVATTYNGCHSYLSLIVCIFGTIANILNIVVLTRKEMASAPINRILTGLAVADMLVMAEYVSYIGYMTYEKHYKNFSYSGAVFLTFHVHFSQILHTVSIFLTLALAVWRYIAIRYPQQSLTLCTDNRCTLAISCSYILPFFVCTPSYFLTKIGSTVIRENKRQYTLYHLDLGDSTMLSHNFNFWAFAVVIKLLPCIVLSLISYGLIQSLYKVHRRKAALFSSSAIHCQQQEQLELSERDNQSEKSSEPTTSLRSPQHRKRSKRKDNNNAINNNIINTNKVSERRAERTTRMLIAVLFLFLITEFPQGILGLLNGIYGRCFYSICYQNFGPMMDMLALLNGAINFILYCCMSRQFRLTFEKLFKPKVLEKWRPKSSQTDVQSTFV